MIISLIVRNFKIYFRDFTAVFFSLLSAVILVALFALFLAQYQIDTVVESVSNNISEDSIKYLVHSWMLAGLLSITTVTAVLGGYGIMVNDSEKKIKRAFKASPMKTWVYPFVNVVSAFLIGIVISMITFVMYIIFIYLFSGYVLTTNQIVETTIVILFSSIINSLILGCMCSFIKTHSAFSAISILVGTIIGFINGLYVPLGGLNENVRNMLSIFPSLHIASIFRKVLTSDAVQVVFDQASLDVITEYNINYGITLQVGSKNITYFASILYVTVFCTICMFIMLLNLKRKNNEM